MSSTRDFKSPGIFAEDASTAIPPTPIAGIAYRDAVNGADDTPNGWRYGTRVESQNWNQIMFLITSMLTSIDKQGILGWSPDVNYAPPAITFGSNGLPYIAIQASGPSTSAQDPISSPLFWEQFGSHGMVVLSTTQSWSVPMAMQLGIVRPKVTVIGAGGGGGRRTTSPGAAGGAGGGIAQGVVDLTGITSISVTVGSGGAGASTDGATGGSGGNSSFGVLLSAGGGAGGTAGAAALASTGGIGVGGAFNYSIGDGSPPIGSPTGGFFGGAGGGCASPPASTGTGVPQAPGQGGGGRSTTAGASGANGVVIIEW
jgi:hypothetical protein